jgi:hypothetical protein
MVFDEVVTLADKEEFAKQPIHRRGGQFPARRCKSLLVSINSLFGAIKFPVPISRELSSNKLILLRSDGRLFAKRPDFHEIPCSFPC